MALRLPVLSHLRRPGTSRPALGATCLCDLPLRRLAHLVLPPNVVQTPGPTRRDGAGVGALMTGMHGENGEMSTMSVTSKSNGNRHDGMEYRTGMMTAGAHHAVLSEPIGTPRAECAASDTRTTTRDCLLAGRWARGGNASAALAMRVEPV